MKTKIKNFLKKHLGPYYEGKIYLIITGILFVSIIILLDYFQIINLTN